MRPRKRAAAALCSPRFSTSDAADPDCLDCWRDCHSCQEKPIA